MQKLLLLAILAALWAQAAGCACESLGSRTLPTGEDKYSAAYD